MVEVRRKTKNFWENRFFLTLGFFWIIFNVFRITTERALIWLITQYSPMIICGIWVCVKNKKNCFDIFGLGEHQWLSRQMSWVWFPPGPYCWRKCLIFQITVFLFALCRLVFCRHNQIFSNIFYEVFVFSNIFYEISIVFNCAGNWLIEFFVYILPFSENFSENVYFFLDLSIHLHVIFKVIHFKILPLEQIFQPKWLSKFESLKLI